MQGFVSLDIQIKGFKIFVIHGGMPYVYVCAWYIGYTRSQDNTIYMKNIEKIKVKKFWIQIKWIFGSRRIVYNNRQ